MRKFSLLLISCFSVFLSIAQVIQFDKEIKINQRRLPKGTQYVDRWGYPWTNILPSNDMLTARATTATCSSFNLIFGDVIFSSGRGFDDQTIVNLPSGHPLGVANIKLGELRQWTACQVFTYISQTISISTTTPPDIVFNISQNDGTGALAFATPYFDISTASNNFQGGLLQLHITTGVDPVAIVEDARITCDFGTNNTWAINGQNIPINSDGNSLTSNGLDFYSIILHEATHALGFFSNTQSNGNSTLTNSNTGKYSLLDRYLFPSNFPNSPNTNTGIPLFNLNTFNFLGNVTGLTSNVIKYFNVNTNSKSYSIFSPTTWESGSSLSHFDDFREPHEDYMMTPGYSGGLRRLYTKAELTVFCDLGYTILSSNTDFSCNDRYAVGVNDFTTINLSGSVTQDVTTNDYDFDGQQIGLDIPSITLLTNAGTISSSGNNITFTSNGTYSGDVIIKYRPYTIPNGRKGSYAIFRITIISPNYCPLDPCNYVCNGRFEEGLTIPQFEAIAIPFPFATVERGGIPGWSSLGNLSQTADCFFRGSTFDTYSSGYPTMGVPLNILAPISPGVETPTSSIPNDRYVGMIQGSNFGMNHSEGIFRQLVKPLEANTQYLLTYSARAIKLIDAVAPPGNSPPALNVSFSNSIPPVNGLTFPNVYIGDINLPTSPIQFTNSTDAVNNWTNVSVPFTTGNAQNPNYIIFQPPITQIANYIYLDNIRLTKVGNPISVITTTSLVNPRIGDDVTFNINICNTGTLSVNNIDVSNVIPVGFTFVSSTFSNYPNHTISTLLAGQCIAITVIAKVDAAVAFNTPLNNCANIVSATSCAQNQSCATVKVLATDISVTTSQSATCSKFKVTISNSGSIDAHNVNLSYTPPSCFGYSSYLVLSGTATYNSNQISIALIPSGGSVVIEFAGNTPTTSCNNTVSLLGTYDEWDLNPSNNSSLIDVYLFCPNVCINIPSISPYGQIEYYHSGGENTIPLMFTSSLQNGNQWYVDGIPVFGETNQSFNYVWITPNAPPLETHTISVKNGNCFSTNSIVKFYFYPSNCSNIQPLANHCSPLGINTPYYVCYNTNSYMQTFNLGQNATYSWVIDNLPNVIITSQNSNVAQLSVGSGIGAGSMNVLAKSAINGLTKYFEYGISFSDNTNTTNSGGISAPVSGISTINFEGDVNYSQGFAKALFNFGAATIVDVSPTPVSPYYFSGNTLYANMTTTNSVRLIRNGMTNYQVEFSNINNDDCFKRNIWVGAASRQNISQYMENNSISGSNVSNNENSNFQESKNGKDNLVYNVKFIEIQNTLGQIVKKSNTFSEINKILNTNKLYDLTSGIYFIRITYKNNTTETIKRFLN